MNVSRWLVLGLVAGCAPGASGDGAPDGGGGSGGADSGSPDAQPPAAVPRVLSIDLTGSLQNACWSPEGDRLVITRFRDGYNEGLSDVFIVDADGGDPRKLSTEEAQNVNLPGACWTAGSDEIVFSSDAVDRDEVWIAPADGGEARRVTERPGRVAFEPAISRDGRWIVFESHPEDADEQGSIWKVRVDGSDLAQLTDGSGDDREPNWSPDGARVVFQSHRSGNWDIWTVGSDGADPVNVTASPWEDTDPSFGPGNGPGDGPGGGWIVFSSDAGGLDVANVFVVPASGGAPIRVREHDGYDGAPSWSPDGRFIAVETASGDPDGSAGTRIAILPAPAPGSPAPGP